jgi:AcrR family transcriptional regulator
MGRGRAAGYEGQRELILACAARLFAQRGYAATSMNEVALASGLSKATLYHYYRDKYALLVSIAQTHVSQLQAIVNEVRAQRLTPDEHLRELIRRIVAEYAGAQDAHRVLTEDVRFLAPDDQRSVLDKERSLVQGFADAVLALRPDLAGSALGKPLTMLLFGMINWMFTWMKPNAQLNYEDVARVVQDLFLGGLPAVRRPSADTR